MKQKNRPQREFVGRATKWLEQRKKGKKKFPIAFHDNISCFVAKSLDSFFMSNIYYTKFSFKNRYFNVGIIPKQEGFDLEVEVKGPLCGDDFQALRKYLQDEGYVEQARKHCSVGC